MLLSLGAISWLGAWKIHASCGGLQLESLIENSLCSAGYSELYFCLFRVGNELYQEIRVFEAVC